MIKLFISHASEDKPFVEPLAEALIAAGFGVWYDKYKLTLGDRLRQSIDKGLRECDYGVVVLSHTFFSKDWPQDELEGLLALEKNNRKLILPLWHGLAREDVAGYSAILAGRLGGRTDRGVGYVVEDIRRATDVSSRSRELEALGDGVAHLLAVSDRITADEREFSRMHSNGVGEKLRQSWSQMTDQLRKSVEGLVQEQGKPHFKIDRGYNGAIILAGPLGKFVEASLQKVSENVGSSAELRIRIGQTTYVDHVQQAATELDAIILKPRMVDDVNVYWTEDGSDLMMPLAVADFILKRFAAHLQ